MLTRHLLVVKLLQALQGIAIFRALYEPYLCLAKKKTKQIGKTLSAYETACIGRAIRLLSHYHISLKHITTYSPF
jgi:hypothetical protein